MIEPKEIEIDGKTFILSKFPAVAGREIIARYTSSAIPKVGDYKVNEEIMQKMMMYVGVKIHDKSAPLMLTTTALIDNHTGNWETLAKLEVAMMEYNCSFFLSGRVSTFLQDIAQKIPESISKILIHLSQQSSLTEKQPSTN
jgi:hypothetical protein